MAVVQAHAALAHVPLDDRCERILGGRSERRQRACLVAEDPLLRLAHMPHTQRHLRLWRGMISGAGLEDCCARTGSAALRIQTKGLFLGRVGPQRCIFGHACWPWHSLSRNPNGGAHTGFRVGIMARVGRSVVQTAVQTVDNTIHPIRSLPDHSGMQQAKPTLKPTTAVGASWLRRCRSLHSSPHRLRSPPWPPWECPPPAPSARGLPAAAATRAMDTAPSALAAPPPPRNGGGPPPRSNGGPPLALAFWPALITRPQPDVRPPLSPLLPPRPHPAAKLSSARAHGSKCRRGCGWHASGGVPGSSLTSPGAKAPRFAGAQRDCSLSSAAGGGARPGGSGGIGGGGGTAFAAAGHNGACGAAVAPLLRSNARDASCSATAAAAAAAARTAPSAAIVADGCSVAPPCLRSSAAATAAGSGSDSSDAAPPRLPLSAAAARAAGSGPDGGDATARNGKSTATASLV
eukprot:360560-Chlamydomonas_euryale.AAC.1